MITVPEWIRESNLIEGIDDKTADVDSTSTWNWLQSQTSITESIILLTHRGIVHAQDPEIAGKWREVQVWVGGYKPPHARDVERLIEQWVFEYGQPSTEKGIKEAHIEFENIHPFVDGNGRTGRMLMNKQRVALGLDPLLIKASERGAYYEWFREARR